MKYARVMVLVYLVGFVIGFSSRDMSHLPKRKLLLTRCDGLVFEDRHDCYLDIFVSNIEHNSLADTVESYRQYLSSLSEPFSDTQCYLVAHVMGEAAALTQNNPETVLTTCVNICLPKNTVSMEYLDLGCVHGAASVWISQRPNIADLSRQCIVNYRAPTDVRDACYFGIGQGLAQDAEGNWENARTSCDQVVIASGRQACLQAFDGTNPINPPSWPKK